MHLALLSRRSRVHAHLVPDQFSENRALRMSRLSLRASRLSFRARALHASPRVILFRCRLSFYFVRLAYIRLRFAISRSTFTFSLIGPFSVTLYRIEVFLRVPAHSSFCLKGLRR